MNKISLVLMIALLAFCFVFVGCEDLKSTLGIDSSGPVIKIKINGNDEIIRGVSIVVMDETGRGGNATT